MNPLDLVILAAAAWRIAYLLVREDAPFRLIARLRQRTTLGGLLECIYCTSVWTAAGVIALWNSPFNIVVYVAAVSGLAMLLHRYTGGNHT